MNERMNEDEIAALEATASDYALENYPISGAQLAALIATLRYYEAGVEKALPIVETVRNRRVSREVNEKWAFFRILALLVILPFCSASVWLTGTFDRFQAAMTQGQVTSSFWVALGMMVISVLVPFVGLFLPLMKWIDKKAQADFDARI